MQVEANIEICPLCLHPIGGDRRCSNPCCREPLDPGDWAPLPAVYGTKGLLPPEGPGLPWRLPEQPPETTSGGCIDSPLPLDLKQEDGVYDIGSSRSCHIRIAGIGINHAVSLYFHKGMWWAFDPCSAPGIAKLNDKPFRNHLLTDNDTLTIAGVRLRYHSDRLDADHGSGVGVVLTVSGLVDRRKTVDSRSAYPRPLLDHVSFAVSGGEFVGILGPSGCGKSTLIKALAGLSKPASGEILFNGYSHTEESAAIRVLTGYLPQDVNASLHDDLTLAEEIRTFLAIHKAHDPQDERHAGKLLLDLGLVKKYEDRQPERAMLEAEKMRVSVLSGGERRRATLLLSLLRNPAILFLDEPAAGLDRATESDLMRDLRHLADVEKKTILCATHELANLHQFHRILAMSRGGIAYDGPPDGMFRALDIPDEAKEDRPRLLYAALSDPDKNKTISDALHLNQSRTLDPQAKIGRLGPSRRVPWFGVFLGYLGRFRDSFLSFVRRGDSPPPDRTLLSRLGASWNWIRRCLFNPPLVLFFWQPLLVAACVSAALKTSFTDAPNERKIIFFSAAIAAFWLGMGGSVRSLVSTRANRCLERLEGVRRGAYLSAVSLATLAKGAAQGIVLAGLLVLLSRWMSCEIPLDGSSAFALAACLVVVEWMGGFIGLALSALSASEAFAVAMVPNLAVFALFFSEPLMKAPGESLKDDTSRGARFARILPAHHAHLAMWDWESPDEKRIAQRHDDTYALEMTALSWFVLCSLISITAQTVHERNWKG